MKNSQEIPTHIRISVNLPWNDDKDPTEWLMEQGYSNPVDFKTKLYEVTQSTMTLNYYFNDPNLALLFKLTWGGA